MKKIESWLSSPWTQFSLRWVIGALFLAAAVPKIMEPGDFAMAVDNYRFLPTLLVNLWALFLPWTELFVGVILIMGPSFRKPFDKITNGAALLSALMYLSFLIAMSAALIKGLDIGCGCFRPEGTDPINRLYLVRDASFLTASLIVFYYHPKMVAKS